MYITDHAYERLRPNYPHAGHKEIVKALSEATTIDAGLLTALTQRANPRKVNSIYAVHPDYQGVFVLADDEPKVITFLRLSPLQWAQLALEKDDEGPALQGEPVEPKNWRKTTKAEREAYRTKRAAWRRSTHWAPEPDTLYRSVSGRVFIGEVSLIGRTAVHFTARTGQTPINGCAVPGAVIRTEQWEMERLRLDIDGVHTDNASVVRP